jgi:hypothetical protein
MLWRHLFSDRCVGKAENGLYRILSLSFRRAKQTHEDDVCFGPLPRAILLTDLSGQHRLSHLLLGMIVIGADVLIFQEREQLMLWRFNRFISRLASLSW